MNEFEVAVVARLGHSDESITEEMAAGLADNAADFLLQAVVLADKCGYTLDEIAEIVLTKKI